MFSVDANAVPEGAIVEEEDQQEVITPQVVQQGSFPAPFGSQIGNSTVDLSEASNEKQMKKEYDEWWSYGRKRFAGIVPYTGEDFKEERNKLKDAWYQKYHGMGLAEYEEARQANQKTMYGYDANLKGWADQMNDNFQALSTAGLAYADFFMDAAGTVGGKWGASLDDRWDKATQLDNEVFQATRRVLSVVLPAIQAGKMTHGALAASPVAR